MNLRLKGLNLLVIFFFLWTFLPANGLIIRAAGESVSQEMILKAVSDGLIDNGKPDDNTKDTKNALLKPKANASGSTARIAYIKFDKSAISGDVTKAVLQLSITFGSGSTSADYNVYGLQEDSWTEAAVNWSNTPNHEETGSKAKGDAELLGTLNLQTTDAERATVKKYNLDVTNFVKNHKDNVLSFMVLDEKGQDVNINIRAYDHKTEGDRPTLILNPSGNVETSKSVEQPVKTEEQKQTAAPEVKKVPSYEIKSVTASNHDGNEPKNTLDGNLDTRWADSVLAGVDDGSWIKFDLGEPKEIGYLGIAFYNGNTRQTFIDIEVSNDNTSWKRVITNKASSGKSIDLEAFVLPQKETARYVRIIGHGNNASSATTQKWNSLTEVEVYAPKNPAEVSTLLKPAAPVNNTAEPFVYPGFVDPKGKANPIYEPNRKPVKTIDVTKAPFNAVVNDGKDDAIAIQSAIEEAAKTPGSEVYLPNGTYDLLTPVSADCFLQLKSGVNLRGESQSGVKLLADASKLNGTTRVIKGFGVKDILLSNMTVTTIKPESGKYPTDTKVNNPYAFGVDYGIYLVMTSNKPCENIVIENANVEHFKKYGVRIEKSHDIIVRNSNFKNATDVAGGGAGYGVGIQGNPKDANQVGTPNDTYYNLVENNTFTGPYIRHGALIQYYAHNNIIRNNVFDGTLLDSIDMHGEDEYLNEIYGNTIKNVLTGGAIGIGNTGGTAPTNHDASGSGNYIHDNVIENTRDGINVIMESPNTRIENNIFRNSTAAGSRGILLKNAPGTIVKNNTFIDNTAPDFIAIYLTHDFGDKGANYVGAGDPENVTIEGNTITNSTNGIVIENGKNIKVLNNKLSNEATGFVVKGGENIITDKAVINGTSKGLPQTGRSIDMTVLVFTGIAVMAAGVFLTFRKKVK